VPAKPAPPPRQLSSARNPVLKEARALQAKKVRASRGLLVAEGEDLIAAAVDRKVAIKAVLFEEERFEESHPLTLATAGVRERYLVRRELLAGVSTLAAPPRALAILHQPRPPSFADVPMPPSLGLFLAGVADPGNVGTIVRTAAALGCDWVALGPGSSDPYHPRAARAAMGSTFALPLLLGVGANDLATREGLRIVAAVSHGGRPPWEADLAAPHILALGAERAGLADSLEVLEANFPVDRITIPQTAEAESLNVSAAAASLLFEALRQRAA